jgi:pyruvate/2-oxoglutarate dehydrogenase complex dihydrolipoamide acyltransferase (E2) component
MRTGSTIMHSSEWVIGLGTSTPAGGRTWRRQETRHYVAADGFPAIRKVTIVTLTFDHSECDGLTAGGFVSSVADAIENSGSVQVYV